MDFEGVWRRLDIFGIFSFGGIFGDDFGDSWLFCHTGRTFVALLRARVLTISGANYWEAAVVD